MKEFIASLENLQEKVSSKNSSLDIPVITIEVWFDARETQTDSKIYHSCQKLMKQDQKLCKPNNMHDVKQYLERKAL